MASKGDELKEEHRPCSSDQSTNNFEEDPHHNQVKKSNADTHELSKHRSYEKNETNYKETDTKQ